MWWISPACRPNQRTFASIFDTSTITGFRQILSWSGAIFVHQLACNAFIHSLVICSKILQFKTTVLPYTKVMIRREAMFTYFSDETLRIYIILKALYTSTIHVDPFSLLVCCQHTNRSEFLFMSTRSCQCCTFFKVGHHTPCILLHAACLPEKPPTSPSLSTPKETPEKMPCVVVQRSNPGISNDPALFASVKPPIIISWKMIVPFLCAILNGFLREQNVRRT